MPVSADSVDASLIAAAIQPIAVSSPATELKNAGDVPDDPSLFLSTNLTSLSTEVNGLQPFQNV